MNRSRLLAVLALGAVPLHGLGACNVSSDRDRAAIVRVAIADKAAPAGRLLDEFARSIERGYAPFAATRIREALASGRLGRGDTVRAQALLAVALSNLDDERSARDLAERVVTDARDLPPRQRAQVALWLSTIYLRAGLIDRGVALLQQASQDARLANDAQLELLATLNLARSPAQGEERAARIRTALRLMPGIARDAEGRELRLAAFRAAVEADLTDAAIPMAIGELYREASAGEDPAVAGGALALLGEWNLRRGHADAALEAIERADAIAAGARISAPVEWRWALARAHAARSERELALRAYASAVAEAKSVRPVAEAALLGAGITWRSRFGPMFLEYADTLLKPGISQTPGQRQQTLRDAIDVIEMSKAAEVADYFRDPCIAPEAATWRPEAMEAGSAVLYPILFPDRAELILSHRDGLEQFTVAVGREDFSRRIDRFRELLEKRTTRQFLRPARDLYTLLIEPLEERLAQRKVTTLIIVPDGPLRTVPFAAIHDGKRFLAERFALATTPGLAMTNVRALGSERIVGIVEGLTVARHGFSALPAVSEELDRTAVALSATAVRDEAFTRARLESDIVRAKANVVHIASHGQFSSDIQQTFLLTYDGRMDLDSLRRVIAAGKTREEPLELLTLSACQTAVGDERAALGLAGVALRAGARSALASLWSVSDESTAELVTEFYHGLVKDGMSRAGALRSAQLHMIGDERFSHPAYWAAFLLIGSWL